MHSDYFHAHVGPRIDVEDDLNLQTLKKSNAQKRFPCSKKKWTSALTP